MKSVVLLFVVLVFMTLTAFSQVEITPETVMEYSVAQMESVIEAFPDEAIPYFALARVYSRSYQFRDAIEQYKKGLERLPGDPEAMYMIGVMHEEMNEHETAIEWYRKVVEAAPTYPNAYERMGRAYEHLGKNDKALEAFRHAVTHTPDDSSSHYYYAQRLFDSGDADQARKHALRCIELDERLSEPYYLMSRIERADGNMDASREWLTTFRDRKRNEQDMFDELPKADDKKSALQAAVNTHMDAFALYYTHGKPEEGKAHLEKAIALAPENESIRVTQLEIAQQERDAKGMEDALRALIRMKPDSPDYHQFLGLLYAGQDRETDALVHLEEAVRLSPEDPAMLRSYARVLLQGAIDSRKALEVMSRALEIDPSAESYDLLSWALFANGRGEASLKAMQQAIILDPSNAAYRQRLQTIQQRLGQ